MDSSELDPRFKLNRERFLNRLDERIVVGVNGNEVVVSKGSEDSGDLNN